MKHTDFSKVKVGDLLVRPEHYAPSVIVKINEKTIDIYSPEQGKVKVNKMLLCWKKGMNDCGYYFVSPDEARRKSK